MSLLLDRGRHAASNYEVVEELAGGAAAAVRWRLETGRTHQIRVHAKHLSHPLLGDETYGSAGTAVTVIGRTNGPRCRSTATHAFGCPWFRFLAA